MIDQLIAATGAVAAAGHGTPASDPEYRFDVERTVTMYASTLARVHSTPVPDAQPGDEGVPRWDPQAIVRQAESAVRDGRVRSDTVGEAYRHVPVRRLVEILAERAPGGTGDPERRSEQGDEPGAGAAGVPENAVLTHGRPDLERLICHQGRPVGFVDWEWAGLADPYRDLAIAARSIATSLSPMLVPVLFERYADAVGGSPRPDPVRLDWYALAAELTP